MLFDHPGQLEAPSLVGGGGSVLFEVFPGGILIQHVGAIGGPGHDVQAVPRLQRVLTPRPGLVLRFLQRAGRLYPQQCPRTHKDWRGGGVLGHRGGEKGGKKKEERKWKQSIVKMKDIMGMAGRERRNGRRPKTMEYRTGEGHGGDGRKMWVDKSKLRIEKETKTSSRMGERVRGREWGEVQYQIFKWRNI